MGYFTKNLKPGEGVTEIIRRYGLTFTFQGIIGVILLLLPFFLLFPLFRWGYLGIGIFFLLLLTAIIFILRLLRVWYFNVFIITNQRLVDIDQRGFFSQTITEINYEKVQDVTAAIKGVFPTMFKYGAVTIQLSGDQARIEIKKIYNPKRIQDLIAESRKQYLGQEKSEGLDLEDLKRVIAKLRASLGEKKFYEVLGTDKNLF